MKYYSFFQITTIVLCVVINGCASKPLALIPTSSQVIGIAVIPQTDAAEKVLGRKEPLIIQDAHRLETLFSVLEMNKDDAPITSVDLVSHDFVVKWRIRNLENMDRSQLYLRLNNPRMFIYESDLGGTTKKYVIKVEADDAKTVWKAIGVTPPGL